MDPQELYRYRKYSLIAVILTLGIILFLELTPFLSGFLGAFTIYIMLRGQMIYLTEKRRLRKSLTALLLLLETTLCFIVPLGLVAWLIANKLATMNVNTQAISTVFTTLADWLQDKIGYDLLSQDNIASIASIIPTIGQILMGGISSLGINIFTLVFILYFMLIGGRRMESYCSDLMPFDRRVSRNVVHEIHLIVRSNAIGIPLLAVIQGFVAYAGYLIFGAPSPLFWGVLTCFATVIPIVGTALVWVPLAGYMALTGAWGPAVGLTLYGTLVVTHVDNVVRFILQKRMAHTHPLITVFGVFIGLSLFGFMGVIFGPLLLAMFAYFVDLFKCKYLDRNRLCS